MAIGVRLRVWGDYACFTRPEMKVERVSYDVMTPSAARGILEAIHWKPAIRWTIDKIHVLKPIRFDTIRRNEVASKAPPGTIGSAMKNGTTTHILVEDERQQRASLILRDVAYVIEAHFDLTAKAGPDDSAGKHLDIFNRRARQGQCFHRPCLGCREFAAHFELIEHDTPLPPSALTGERDLDWMLYDIDFQNAMTPRFYRPRMIDGVINVQKAWEAVR